RHVEAYIQAGIDLTELPLVGLGSICRRQGTYMVTRSIHELARAGIKLHGFGLKIRGLRSTYSMLASADSLAWSYRARRNPALPGCHHPHCQNCLRYALQWRRK